MPTLIDSETKYTIEISDNELAVIINALNANGDTELADELFELNAPEKISVDISGPVWSKDLIRSVIDRISEMQKDGCKIIFP